MNVSAVALKERKDGNIIYSLELTIENPRENRTVSHTLSQRGATSSNSGASNRKLSSFRSFVEKEKGSIKKQAEKDGSFMKAPNGEQTKLTEDQWLTVRTKAFKNWFGDWENDPENASKVIDENGEPLVVYHGTMDEFTEFDFSRAGENYQQYGMDEGFMFFSSVESEAAYSADGAIEAINDRKQAVADENGEEDVDFIPYEDTRIMPVFINLRNPLVDYFNEDHLGIWDLHWQELRKEIAREYNRSQGNTIDRMGTTEHTLKEKTDTW